MFTNSASKVADAFDSIELMANDLLRFEYPSEQLHELFFQALRTKPEELASTKRRTCLNSFREERENLIFCKV